MEISDQPDIIFLFFLSRKLFRWYDRKDASTSTSIIAQLFDWYSEWTNWTIIHLEFRSGGS